MGGSESDIIEAKEKINVQPILPFVTPIHITKDHFEKVPRVYIETLKDKAISITGQREMYNRTPCWQIITLDTDHSPYFSQPEVLSSHLKSLVSE